MNSLFKEFSYRYASAGSLEGDQDSCVSVLGPGLDWEFTHREAKVTAIDLLASNPHLKIADRCVSAIEQFLYGVESLKTAVKKLESEGLKLEGKQFELLDEPCRGFSDHLGSPFGIFEMVRPQPLVRELGTGKRDRCR